jgi:outer membrane immunogenic protein
MRTLFHATSALAALLATSLAAGAADLHVKAKPMPPAPVPPPFSWTGFYIGANAGGAFFRNELDDTLFGMGFNQNHQGVFIGGGQVGFNYQINQFVWGFEGDFDGIASDNTTNAFFIPVMGQTFQVNASDRFVATIAGRIGYAWDRVLLYAKGGYGWVGFNGFTVTNLNTGASFIGSGNNTASGWLVGGGLEWAFWENWSLRFEYNFLQLTRLDFSMPVGFPFNTFDTFRNTNHNVQLATVGINWRFGWGPYGPYPMGPMVTSRY